MFSFCGINFGNISFKKAIYVKKIRFKKICLTQNLSPRKSIRLQVLKCKLLNNQKYYQLKNVLHKIHKGAYLETYLKL